MKTPLIVAALVAGLLTLSDRAVFAQPGAAPAGQPPQGPPPQGQPGAPRNMAPTGMAGNGPTPVVAVFDFALVMKNYNKSKMMMDGLQKDQETAAVSLRKETAEIEKEKEKLKGFRPGSKEYKDMEEQLAERVSQLNVRIKILQRDFQERQQKSIFQLYTEIRDEVKRYCDAHGISLVMDFSSEPIDPNSPESMGKEMSKTYVFANGPDITNPVLAELNRRTANLPGANRPANGPAGSAPPRTR